MSRFFDGVNDKLIVGDNNLFDFGTGSFSVVFFAKRDATLPVQDARFFCKGSNTATGKRYEAYYNPQFDVNGAISFAIDDNVSKSQIDAGFTDDLEFADGNWHFYIFERNVTDDKIRIYEDNILVAEGTDVTGDTDNTQSFRIGNAGDNSDVDLANWFRGYLAEFSVFNKALSSQEKIDIRTGTNPTTITGCIAYWDMAEDESPEQDESSNNLDMTVSGTTYSVDHPVLGADVPVLSTQGQTALGQTTATLSAQITDDGGSTITERGFQYNTVDYPDKSVYETGGFAAGAYTLNVIGLTPGQTYYVRAYATNSSGTGYGEWVQVTTNPPIYSIIINDIDRTSDVLNGSVNIEDVINDKQNIGNLILVDLSGNGIPENDQEIVITLDDGTKIFGGYIVSVSLEKTTGAVYASVSFIDYVRLLDRKLVHKTYEDMTEKEIIDDIISTYAAGSDITTNNVVEAVTIDQISFNYIQPSQAIRQLADLTGRNWYIDYDKDIHFFPKTTNAAPFNISSSNNQYSKLKISKDASQIKNRVYVRGGTKLSDTTTYSEKGDGIKIKYVLPDKPHDVSVTVNGVSKSLGIKNIDTSGYDWYLNYQEKYIEQDSGGTPLATTDTLVVTYKYDIPILVALENTASILEHGQQEFAIFDKQITTTQAARDRASAELTDYANNIIEGTFETFTPGFRSGQYININLSEYDVNEDYIIQKVKLRSIGGGLYVYNISVASSKTMGIIRFLIELLEANRNLIVLDDNEVVDELFNITDALLSDSLTDNLTIDSAGPYATWCSDSLQSSPATRAIWELFQWG